MFAIAFSLSAITSVSSSHFQIPTVHVAYANSAPCPVVGSSGSCSQLWTPAGPAENSMTDLIFTDETAEYTALQTLPSPIDLTDWQCSGTPTTDVCGTLTSGSAFQVTSPLAEVGYYEVEFMLINNFWNCNFNFGNSLCGIQIRQGFAHMFDKNAFCSSTTSTVAGTCTTIDNPLPTTTSPPLTSPDSCGYDLLQSQSGSNCIVGSATSQTSGGVAYHINAATGADGYSWLYAPGSADLNLVCQHFVAAGVGTSCNTSTSILSGFVGGTIPTFFIRNDNTPRQVLGESIAAQICYVLTGSYVQPCTGFFNTVEGPITAFPGFTTSPKSVNLNWWMYTAAFSGPTFFDGLYFGYNSHFASASCASPGTNTCTTQQIGGGPCSNASVGTASAGDYEYICVSGFDSLTQQLESSACITATVGRDPTFGSTITTYGSCTGTGSESVVNATTTTYSGQPVLFGTRPATGASLSTGPFFWSCANGFTLNQVKGTCTSGSITEQASLVFAGTGCSTTSFDQVCDVLLWGNEQSQGSSLTAATSVEFAGSGTFRPGTLSAESYGVQAEQVFVAQVLTLPVFELTIQFGYLNNGWNNGVINNAVTGLPNYFTWLNAWNSAPPTANTIRQGFKETTRSVSPYIASTVWDTYIVSEVYDSLFASNPVNPSQIFNWMTLCYTPGGGCSIISENNATVISQSGYTPPPHTVLTYHFTLNPGLFFQDGRSVTAYDVAFSYLSMVGSGAFLGTVASTMTGVTVLGPRTFDISVNSVGPFEVPNLTSLPILSGGYWTGAGAPYTEYSPAWHNAIGACTSATPCPRSQYALNGATVYCPSTSGQPGCPSPAPSATIMQVDPNKITATYDPILSHTLVGSGPWECGPVTSIGSGLCSTTGTQNPPTGDTYTLTRFGCTNAITCLAPASSTSGIYFRSSGDLALYAWSEENDISPSIPLSAVELCFGLAIGAGACAHWQQGIGANTNTGFGACGLTQPGCVGSNQLSEVLLRYSLNWITPFEWTTGPPLGIVATPPVLYEGAVTLSPCPTGGSSPPGSTTGYDC